METILNKESRAAIELMVADGIIAKDTAERYFPELKDSKDKRIRKVIIEHFACSHSSMYPYKGFTKKEILDWLEKQGECHISHDDEIMIEQLTEYLTTGHGLQNTNETVVEWLNSVKKKFEKQGEQESVPDWMPKFLDELRSKKNYFDWDEHRDIEGSILAIIKWMNPNYFNEKDGEQKPYGQRQECVDCQFNYAGECKGSCVMKRSEQKPTDTVEPKFNFKVGQWIVATGKCIYLIAKIDGLNVTLIDTNGDEYVFDTSSLDDAYQWTIQDAKDGDVLADKTDGVIGIFQSIGHHPDGGSYNDPSYCFLHCRYDDGYFYADFENGNTMDSDDAIPATKEQRDTLFEKMREAGYTFDFDKKELKKIEQKPAWSEEDEVGLGDALWAIEQARTIAKDENNMGSLWYAEWWLKSLKDRVLQQNITYYNPYKEVIESIAEMCKHYDKASHNGLRDFYDNVKVKCKDAKEYDSLYPQNTWKPSKEQLEALKNAIHIKPFENPSDSLLYGLYEQLNKL